LRRRRLNAELAEAAERFWSLLKGFSAFSARLGVGIVAAIGRPRAAFLANSAGEEIR
jgi:hypothetical protein